MAATAAAVDAAAMNHANQDADAVAGRIAPRPATDPPNRETHRAAAARADAAKSNEDGKPSPSRASRPSDGLAHRVPPAHLPVQPQPRRGGEDRPAIASATSERGGRKSSSAYAPICGFQAPCSEPIAASDRQGQQRIDSENNSFVAGCAEASSDLDPSRGDDGAGGGAGTGADAGQREVKLEPPPKLRGPRGRSKEWERWILGEVSAFQGRIPLAYPCMLLDSAHSLYNH